VHAFDQLTSEGYLENRIGSGSYVSRVLPEELLHVASSFGARSQTPRPQARHLSDYARRLTPFPALGPPRARAFRVNLPAIDLFPVALWAQVTARCLRRASTRLLMGCDTIGYQPLREAITHYLASARGVRCTASQVIVVSGAQESFDLIARLFLTPADQVCMEEPGYFGARTAFESYGARIVPTRVDAEGMSIPSIRHARLAYVTPGHQFPLGVTMSLPRRLALLEWARVSGALILEDDYDSEYRYSGRPVPSLQGLDRDGCVLFCGTFSKILFPSLRLGYLVVPPDLVEPIAAAKSVSTRHAPLLDQVVLSDFIAEGHMGRHVRRMREVYSERLAVLIASAKQDLGGLLEVSGIEAGLQTIGWLRQGIGSMAAASAAERHGVEITPVQFFANQPLEREAVHLGFAAIEVPEIRRGVRQLASALESEAKRVK
jgi:GntR family transcriptional regulator/MocR family aminotransferase